MNRRFFLTAVAVLVLAIVAHAPGLAGNWVYDDERFIAQNPALASLDIGSYVTDVTTASAGEGIQPDVYRPLRTLVFALEWQVLGNSPTGWHIVSLLLHALASVLVLRLLWPLVGRDSLVAGAGAAIFAVHPVGVECVAWVSCQGDLLALVLMLAALIVLERRGAGRTVLGCVLMALACLAKESALVLPALLLLRDLALGSDRAPGWRVTLLRVALLAVVAGGYLALRFAVIPDLAQVPEFPGGSRIVAAGGMLAGLVWYAGALLWPSGFPFDFHLPLPLSFTDPEVILGLGLLVTLVAAGIRGWRRGDALLAFATLGALACLVPVSNVIVPLKAIVAERFLYPVLVCFAVGIACGVRRLPGQGRWLGGVFVSVVVVVLIPVTWSRTTAWADDLVLWETVLRERPSHMRAYEGLGFEYHRQGRLGDAERAYRSYLEYNPADGKVMRLLGDVFGDVADSLRIPHPRPGMTTDIAEKRHEARIAQLTTYGNAISTWERIGLVPGRGSERMLLETYDRIMAAAWDLGDLRKVKWANDALLHRQLEGVEPGADPEAVRTRALLHHRRMRLDLAWRALTAEMPRDLGRDLYERRMAERATVVNDVDISPGLSDREALEGLLPLYRGFLAELEGPAGKDVPRRQMVIVLVSLRIAHILDHLGARRAAEQVLEDLRRRYPGHELLERGG